MKKQAGDLVGDLQLPSIDGKTFSVQEYAGKPYMLSFFRFATCPFCNMRVHELVSQFDEFGRDFGIIAIFDSPLDNLQRHASGHQAPFPILADAANQYYQAFAIEKSWAGLVKGFITRFPQLVRGLMMGYIPFPIRGSLITMPADFLVNRQGRIEIAYYGQDEGDHLAFEKVKAFSLSQDGKQINKDS